MVQRHRFFQRLSKKDQTFQMNEKTKLRKRLNKLVEKGTVQTIGSAQKFTK